MGVKSLPGWYMNPLPESERGGVVRPVDPSSRTSGRARRLPGAGGRHPRGATASAASPVRGDCAECERGRDAAPVELAGDGGRRGRPHVHQHPDLRSARGDRGDRARVEDLCEQWVDVVGEEELPREYEGQGGGRRKARGPAACRESRPLARPGLEGQPRGGGERGEGGVRRWSGRERPTELGPQLPRRGRHTREPEALIGAVVGTDVADGEPVRDHRTAADLRLEDGQPRRRVDERVRRRRAGRSSGR